MLPPPPDRPRGADGHILATLVDLAGERGQIAISLVDLSAECGYTVPTVQASVRRLELRRYVLRSQPDPRQPTCYEIVPAQLRHTIIAGELVGLLQRAVSL